MRVSFLGRYSFFQVDVLLVKLSVRRISVGSAEFERTILRGNNIFRLTPFTHLRVESDSHRVVIIAAFYVIVLARLGSFFTIAVYLSMLGHVF